MPLTEKIATSSAVHEDQDWHLQFDTCNTLGPIDHRIVPNAEPSTERLDLANHLSLTRSCDTTVTAQRADMVCNAHNVRLCYITQTFQRPKDTR